MTTPAQARNLLASSFRAAWIAGGYPATSVEWQNLNFDPTSLDLWCRFSVQHAPTPTRELGGGDQFFVARGGIIQIEMFLRANEAMTKLDAAAEIALKWLETFGVGDIRFRDPGLFDLGPANGAWYQQNAVASFEYDSVRDV